MRNVFFLSLLALLFFVYFTSTKKEGFTSSIPDSEIRNAIRMWSQGGSVRASNGKSYTFEQVRMVNNHPFFDELIPGNVQPVSQEVFASFLDGKVDKELSDQIMILADFFINKESEQKLERILKDISTFT